MPPDVLFMFGEGSLTGHFDGYRCVYDVKGSLVLISLEFSWLV